MAVWRRGGKGMRVRINKNLCTGCGLCPDLCPEVFALDGYLAVLLVDEVPAASHAACRKTAAQCPLAAVEIVN